MKKDEVFKFDGDFVSEELETTTYYFCGDKRLLTEYFGVSDYPDAEKMTLSIEFPTDRFDIKAVGVSVSPSKDGCDYDWTDISYFEEDKINSLMNLARKALKEITSKEEVSDSLVNQIETAKKLAAIKEKEDAQALIEER